MIEVDTTPKRIPLRVQVLTAPNLPGAIVRWNGEERPVDADGFVTIEVEIPWNMDIVTPTVTNVPEGAEGSGV